VDRDPHDRTRPPQPNTTLMTEAEALEWARGENTDAPASALLVRYGDIAAANPQLAASARVHPDRMAWVVTVHAEGMTRGGIHTMPQPVHVYSIVINAEPGSVPEFADVGFGDAAVRDGKLVVKPVQRGHDLSHDPTAGPPRPDSSQKLRD